MATFDSSNFSQTRAHRCAPKGSYHTRGSHTAYTEIFPNLSLPFKEKSSFEVRLLILKKFSTLDHCFQKIDRSYSHNWSAIFDTANRRKRPFAICFDRFGTG